MNNRGESGDPEGEEQRDARGGNITHQHFYHGPVNQIGRIERMDNCNLGVNHGHLIQNKGAKTPSGSSSRAHGREAQPQDSPNAGPLIITGSQHDILAFLNPILDASHTRNRLLSPPNSACFVGTRQSVINLIRAWANSSLIFNDNPHIMWIYGYAGCGKSAIAQEVAEYFARKGQLVASFFFFRGSGDRSSTARFATTIASQMASAISATAPAIEAAVRKNRGLLTTTTATLSAQFQHLVYEPFTAIIWERMAASLRGKPFLVILDGLDECEDRGEVAAFIENMIAFFNKKPRIPLRFLITSRVENHIHQRLHSSNQVQLLDLVDHTSDSDIAAALEVAIENEKHSRVLACDSSWPSAEDKAKLVKHIGGSYIFMMTIIRLLFDPNLSDGLTPMDRLPRVLSTRPDFDSLYKAILSPWKHQPYFHIVVSTIALAMKPLSIAQIAELMEIGTVDVVNVLVNLHAIMQIPGDDRTAVTLWHTSLRDFLCSKARSGSLYASPAYHRHLAYRCITLSASSSRPVGSPITKYSRHFALDHWAGFMQVMNRSSDAFSDEITSFIRHLRLTIPEEYVRVVFTYFKVPAQAPDGTTLYDRIAQAATWKALKALLKTNTDINHLFIVPDRPTELEIASQTQNWKVVRVLLNANTDVNGLFHETKDNIVCALHAVCCHEQWDLIYLLLEKGADPNIISPNKDNYRGGFWHGTPLAFAASRREVKLVTRLLECGANPNLQGGFYDTALQAACAYGSIEMVNLLLNNGADPKLRGGSWGSALHACANYGYNSCAQALLTHKADPNIQDKNGNTPLHDACYRGNIKVVECLLEFKIDTSIKNNKGQTALQVAQESSYLTDRSKKDVMELLLRHGIVE